MNIGLTSQPIVCNKTKDPQTPVVKNEFEVIKTTDEAVMLNADVHNSCLFWPPNNLKLSCDTQKIQAKGRVEHIHLQMLGVQEEGMQAFRVMDQKLVTGVRV